MASFGPKTESRVWNTTYGSPARRLRILIPGSARGNEIDLTGTYPVARSAPMVSPRTRRSRNTVFALFQCHRAIPTGSSTTTILSFRNSLPHTSHTTMPITTTSPTVAGGQILRKCSCSVKNTPNGKEKRSQKRDLLSFYQHQAPLQHIKDNSTRSWRKRSR